MNYFGSFGSGTTEALECLMPVIDRALHAHLVGDYEAYRSVITSELAAKVTEEGFLRAWRDIAPSLGELQSRTFLGALRRDGNPMLLLSARFSGTDDDVLINVTFRNGSTPPLIDWLWIE